MVGLRGLSRIADGVGTSLNYSGPEDLKNDWPGFEKGLEVLGFKSHT